ncbi:MAG: nickel pincer cofactor biosynthesis protein LarC [Lachnospiraceae bacterium]|nr:nickel pincer cofactor biosynthesis protein LarC [Lachnospiraceae bacterium]MDD5852952.1 nickel pincer cofactor biosynthesis protein LarC [Lachnospiraceae bacterium]
MNSLYLECNAGISGDMTVAALLDLGADEKVLRDVLDSVPADGFSIAISRVKKAGVDCCDFNVVLDKEHENHDHDMAYLHGDETVYAELSGHEHSHHDYSDHDHIDHSHDHSDHDHTEHSHDHSDHDHVEHSHDHTDHGHHHHEHRGLPEIREIINHTQMTENARSLALKIFEILAKAEAKAHATDIDHVHFHEVGAIDSIVDIIAVAVCIDNLGIDKVYVPKLCEGMGTVRCQHGILSIPVPATANIMEAYQLPIEIMNVQGEFVTPTGAAIVAALKTDTHLPGQFCIKKIGLGAGKRTYQRPSILRAMLIEACDGTDDTENNTESDAICKLETNIDDCSGEVLGYTMERLFAAGARDVHYMPVFMKKNRPGWQLNVICDETKIAELEQIIFEETTTIGIRRIPVERSVLDRQIQKVMTPLGEAEVKICQIGQKKKIYPEYESVVRLCKEHHMTYQEVFDFIIKTTH